ncbi:MAG: EAL domain-containing protein, partial [Planctomycetota bacterium]
MEITETTLMNDSELSAKTLNSLRALGINIAVDDFGTGYSSLAYLHRFPLDSIKIDKSFVQHMIVDSTSMVIDAIQGLANGLEIHTVAEGIETVEQLRRVQESGCQFGQGYLFSRAQAPRDVVDSIRNGYATLINPNPVHTPTVNSL